MNFREAVSLEDLIKKSEEEIKQTLSGVKEMVRVMKPDGHAALVLPNSFYLVDIVKSSDGRKNFFVFEDNNGLINKTQTEYINGTAKVSAKDLIDNIRALKTLTNVE